MILGVPVHFRCVDSNQADGLSSPLALHADGVAVEYIFDPKQLGFTARICGRREVVGVEFFDDEAVLLEDEDPQLLNQKLMRAHALFTGAAKECGFRLNNRPGKTEAIVVHRGRGTQEAKDQMHVAEGQLFIGEVRVVKDYKHVGTWTSATGHPGRELHTELPATAKSSPG